MQFWFLIHMRKTRPDQIHWLWWDNESWLEERTVLLHVKFQLTFQCIDFSDCFWSIWIVTMSSCVILAFIIGVASSLRISCDSPGKDITRKKEIEKNCLLKCVITNSRCPQCRENSESITLFTLKRQEAEDGASSLVQIYRKRSCTLLSLTDATCEQRKGNYFFLMKEVFFKIVMLSSFQISLFDKSGRMCSFWFWDNFIPSGQVILLLLWVAFFENGVVRRENYFIKWNDKDTRICI